MFAAVHAITSRIGRKRQTRLEVLGCWQRNIPRVPGLAPPSGERWLHRLAVVKGDCFPLGIDYLLVLVVLSTSAVTAPVPVHVGHFHSLENCIAAANEAKATQPIGPATFGFICVRDNDIPITRPR
jgi:hypothetical protein